MGLYIVLVIFAAVLGVIIGTYVRRRNMSFEGVVTDKDIRETTVSTPQERSPGTISIGRTNQGNLKHDYIIKVQIASGKVITWSVTEGKYEIIKIGDRVSKPKGTTDIQITPQVASNTTPPATPAV